ISSELTVIIVIHVDDFTLVTTDLAIMQRLKSTLAEHYELADMGNARWLLGFEIQRDRISRSISLNQSAYVDTLISRFNMHDAYPAATPLDPAINLFLPVTAEDRDAMVNRPYAQLIGSLMYAAIGTRPDIMFAVSTLARFMSDPSVIHWEAGKRVLRYLKGTRDHRLTFGGDTPAVLTGFTDADWASQPHRHSISGFVFTYACGAISWGSHKQSLIALSSTEAEYISASDSCRELIYLRSLILELTGETSSSPITLHSDNQSAIRIAANGLLHARTKHIDIRYQFIRQVVERGLTELVYCPTNEMVANIFTKALVRSRIQYLAGELGLSSQA
ncbi:hypothetical protein EUX98_g8096, partial [Antrodiella citrinella]